MGVADELARLVAERDAGDLSDEEFEQRKAALLAHPELARTAEPAEPVAAISERRRKNRTRAFVVASLIIVALVAWVVVSESMIGPAHLVVRVDSITASGPESLAVTATLTNTGGQTGLGQCEVVVKVPNASGGLAEVTPAQPFDTPQPVRPGRRETGSANLAVLSGDAPYVTAADLDFTCQ